MREVTPPSSKIFMVTNSKKKGIRFELLLSDWLTALLGIRYRRTPNSGAMRQDWPFDLIKVDRKPCVLDDIGIEAKDCADLPKFVTDWIDEANEAAIDGNFRNWALIFHRPKTTENFVLMKQSTFGNLIKEVQDYRDRLGEH